MEKNKPLCLILEEANQTLTDTVLSLNLPCYLLVPMLENILHRLENGRRTEIETAKQSLEATEKEAE